MSHIMIVGERLNTQRERFRTFLTERDTAAVRREARRQVKAGVTHLDFHTSLGSAEIDTQAMKWLLETILPEIPARVGVVLDSAHRECLETGLELLKGRTGTILNSASASREQQKNAVQDCIDLAAFHNVGVMALLVPSEGSEDNEIKLAESLRTTMTDCGVPDEHQYYDPHIFPVAFDPKLPSKILNVTQQIKARWPRVHVALGVSNVSFNMPSRGVLNGAFLAMLMAAGADTFICDPCQRITRQTLIASKALLGMDDFFADYLAAFVPED